MLLLVVGNLRTPESISLNLGVVSPPAEVGVDVREAVVLSQGEQDAGRAASLTLAAEAAVANATTGRALPLLRR